MSDELTRLSAARAAELIRGGELSPVELAGAYLRRVESLNPRLNAVVTIAPDVLKLARKAEAAVARGETLEQARESVNLEDFRKRLVGESQVRRVAFSMYVAGPAVAAAFREASAAKAGGE